jgi:hypothetical protein
MGKPHGTGVYRIKPQNRSDGHPLAFLPGGRNPGCTTYWCYISQPMPCDCHVFCSKYSLHFSKMEPHAASSEAKIKVEQLMSDLANFSLREGIAASATLWKGVPKGSLAMLVCKVWLREANAPDYYPRRPPMCLPKDADRRIWSPDGRLGLPAFLIHFS